MNRFGSGGIGVNCLTEAENLVVDKTTCDSIEFVDVVDDGLAFVRDES